jgi:hypothetical protein
LYGEKIHYALELIQNAEDEGATAITFIFNKRKLIVVNDGKPFDTDDVWTICSVRPGKKRNKIGFFGIGFKSVFNITNSPQIISGEFNFQIRDYIYPHLVPCVPPEAEEYYLEDKGTVFVLPYTQGLPSPQELIENFQQIDEKLLLFLESLSELNFVDNINNKHWSIKKKSGESIVILTSTKDNKETRWSVFTKDLEIYQEELIPEGKEGITQTRVVIAFPQDAATREAAKRGVVYCYLPTKRRTDLPFLIQADFLPTIGRGDIAENKWNEWLLKNLGGLAADVFDAIKDNQNFSDSLYELIPLDDELKDELIKSSLGKALYKGLKQKKVAKTTEGIWVKPSECAIPLEDQITNIVSKLDLHALFGKNLLYNDSSLSQRAKEILIALGAYLVGKEHVIELLKKDTMVAKRRREWFLELYDF